MATDFSEFYEGKKLYGDNFSLAEIEAWFADEAEGYAELGAKDQSSYKYVYHALNRKHLYKHLQKGRLNRVLGLGSAYGYELEPIADRTDHFTILDPSDAFSDTTEILDTPCTYTKPQASGKMPFEDNSFDLITCFGVLHHIPNVSRVIGECYRCLKPGGVMLAREPISSMGDWNKPRRGLTKRERGIPSPIFKRIVADSGFTTQHSAYSNFPGLPKLFKKAGVTAFNSPLPTLLDSLCCMSTVWNISYHRTTLAKKIAPGAINLVLKK